STLRLIALNAELQVFHPFSANNVPNPHVDCVEHVNFVGSRQMVELALKMKQLCVEQSLLKEGTMSGNIEFLALKPPMRNIVGSIY
ncbi:hypothetical protein Tco_0061048, partial [Tanacetum coccineum]